MPNRLASESSPYLRQHRDNPVDWYPWGDEAFTRARTEDKPIFLSVGYSSCHWCHVMEHESFEDSSVADVLNRFFVCVKVDREERPDVDEAYMTAVQLSSGRGGWPMSLFLTPDRRPFFAGTYFPRDDRGQSPGFLRVCEHIVEAWRGRRNELEKVAHQIDEALRTTFAKGAPASGAAFDQAFVDRAIEAVLSDFDGENGGFGSAPKFPPHTALSLLISYAMHPASRSDLREAAVEVVLFTLQRMAMGGIHDHVGGGFHRYSTDARWLLPHFEKMLYDNALMLENYARGGTIAAALMPDLAERFQAAAAGIVDWLLREMHTPEGLFCSALDADSEGEEGKYYVWTANEAVAVLGDRASAFMSAFGFAPEGNFEDEATRQLTGANIPHLTAEPGGQFDADLERLLEARQGRIAPGLDDKAIVAWNGLVIGAMSDVGLLPAAALAIEAILEAESILGELPHQVVKGVPSGKAFLDDYAYFVEALFRFSHIAQAFEEQGEPFELPRTPAAYRSEAERLGRRMVAEFYDEANGGFFSVGVRHEVLFGRTKPVFDQPTPSANAIALRVLMEMGDEKRARQTISGALGWMERAPQATEALLEACLPLLALPPAPSSSVLTPPAQAARPASEPVLAVPPSPTASTAKPLIETASPAPAEPKTAIKPPDVTVKVTSRELVAGPDGVGHTEVRLSVPEGFHVNSNEPPARWLKPTQVEVRPLKATVTYPTAVNDRFEGDFSIQVAVPLPPGQSAAEFELRVTYQACTESDCLLAVERTFDAVVVKG